jgi:Ca-activated chloride channel homolog
MAFISCREATSVALITAALGVPATLSAQKTVFKTGVEMVPLTVTVTDTKGKYVTGLAGSNFEVFEDGVQQDVAFFASDDVPLDVALLVDTSGSMDADLPLVKSAAAGLVAKLRTSDRAIVVDVKGSTRVAQELTSDQNSIARAIHGLSAGGETAVYDAVYLILRELERERRTAAQVRRQALVLLTDGIDTRSRLAFEDVLDVARRGNVSIYVVELKGALAQTPRSALPGAILRSDYALKSVTRESGGRLFEPKTAVDLPGIYSAIAEELFSQYDLGYMPLRAVGNGDFRRVAVRLRPQTNALARTRTGYIASSTRAAMAR